MSYDNPPGSLSQVTPNSSTAIISLIAGVLGLTILPFIGSIVALITGYMARNEIRQSGGGLSGEGLATAGVVLGWIGVALAVVGFCLAALFIGFTFCLIPWGVWRNYGALLPILTVF